MERTTEEDYSSSAQFSWKCAEAKKRRKHLNVYMSNSYGDTDFGDINDDNHKWMIGYKDMTEGRCTKEQEFIKFPHTHIKREDCYVYRQQHSHIPANKHEKRTLLSYEFDREYLPAQCKERSKQQYRYLVDGSMCFRGVEKKYVF
ncbi:hypothetical protein K492DRAFT_180670 [Lichtheimia hyalospora FSU 10163]|nr:hypothetical protein K492DRAFT_180670 [Lichtheimia hyalospora FSU 10163]